MNKVETVVHLIQFLFEISYIQYIIRHREMLEIVFYILFPHSAQSKLILDGN